MADDRIALQSRLGIEHAAVHLLGSTVFEGVLILYFLHGGIQQYRVLVEDQDVVEHLLHVVYLMGRNHHSTFLCHVLGYHLAELRLRRNIQSVGGLIHQQILGVGRHGEGNIGLLTLTHGEFTQTYVGRQLEISQTTLQDFVGEIGVERFVEFHIFREADGRHLKLFGHKEDVTERFGQAVFCCNCIATNSAMDRAQQAREQVEQRRLTCTVLS